MTDTVEAPLLPDPECVEAEREAAEAAGLVEALEARVMDGDEGITAADLRAQRDLAGFAKLRLEAVRRKQERAHEKRRMAELRKLREEIDSFTTTSGPRFVELLTAASDAVAAFKVAVEERNALVTGWRARAEHLGAPETGLVDARDDDGTVTVGSAWGEVIAGRRSLRPIDADFWLGPGLGAQRGMANQLHIEFKVPHADLVRLSEIDAPTP